MGLAVSKNDIELAHAAGDELVDRLLQGFRQVVEQALSGTNGRPSPVVAQLADAGSALLQQLQAVEGKTVVDLRELLDGLRLDITIPPITVKLSRPSLDKVD